MSSIEVSLMTPMYGAQPKSTDRPTGKTQRPPPPIPSEQAQITSTVVSSAASVNSSVKRLDGSRESIETLSKAPTTLLSEFQRLFDEFDYQAIRDEILDRHMIHSEFSTVLWRIFLHCLPRDLHQWTDVLETSRKHYEKLSSTYQVDLRKNTGEEKDQIDIHHPLSQHKDSAWTQHFHDEQLRNTIKIDVCRTCPDVSFFRNPEIIELQVRILFTHHRHHEKTSSYRQGMHEILGIIVYTLNRESLRIKGYPHSNDLMKLLYDSQYLEHDAYSIFEKMIGHLQQFYGSPVAPSALKTSPSTNDIKKIPFEKPTPVQVPTNEAVIKMRAIFDRLKEYDKTLHKKLVDSDIEPTIYGIRWVRLLFSREIPFEHIPNLWTVIFCFNEDFGFVDYFFNAFLLALGRLIEKQKAKEHGEILELLMKQNLITYVEPVIRHALQLSGRKISQIDTEPIVLSKRDHESHTNPLENRPDNPRQSKQFQRVPLTRTTPQQLTILNMPDATNSVSSTSETAMKPMTNENASTTVETPLQEIHHQPSESSETDLWSGSTTKQRYEDNLRLQKCCAQYMHKFIGHLQNLICEMKAPEEDKLLIQIAGLKQVANVLDGRLTFDQDSLEALVRYGRK